MQAHETKRIQPKFPVDGLLGDHKEYKVVDKGGPQSRRSIPRPLGDGGAGTVYRVRFKDRLDRAIKFLVPESHVDANDDSYIRTFARERELLFDLTHRNIVKILDFGEYIDVQGHGWPYLVMEFISGERFLPTCQSDQTSGADIMNTIEDVLDGLVFLHSQAPPVLHSDIKSANVLCRRTQERFEAVILDLGAAHVLPDTEPNAPREFIGMDTSDTTLFVSTKEIAHPNQQDIIGKEVPRSKIAELFPFYDLFALGKMINEALGDKAVEDKLREHLGTDGLGALIMLKTNLLGDPQSPYYTDVRRVRTDWRKLSDTYLAPIGIPELSIAAQFRHSLLGPFGRAIITERLYPIINHKLFQRLRDIPQLEYVALKYPGATHSRLQHAASVYRNARYYLAHLLNHPTFRLMASKSDLEATLLLALLHDLGHFQLSHMFEDYATEDREHHVSIESSVVDDDDLFLSVLDPDHSTLDLLDPLAFGNTREWSPYSEEVDRAWSTSCERLGMTKEESIASLIVKRFGIDTLESMIRIRSVIMRKGTGDAIHNILAGVLSSPIDADKISYLVDDAWETGVSYGKGIDIDGVLGALRPPNIEQVKGPTIAISDKGIAAVESVAMARQWMLRQVYWHHTNRAVMAMCKYVISRLRSAGALNFGNFLEQSYFWSLSESTHWLSTKFDSIREDAEVNPLRGLLESERAIYKRVCTKSEGPSGSDAELHNRLYKKSYGEILELEKGLSKELSGKMTTSEMGGVSLGEVLLDVPKKDRASQGGQHSAHLLVYPRDPERSSQEIEVSTPLFQNLGLEHMVQANKIRVFVSPRIFDLHSGRELWDFFDNVLSRV